MIEVEMNQTLVIKEPYENIPNDANVGFWNSDNLSSITLFTKKICS